ncbi:DUF2961 domain-containing protein [bacterium]|nr:DUF2961 domain-containing protein [bacterium]
MEINYDGLGNSLSDLTRLSNAVSRSISAENFKGEKGKGAMATEGALANAARELGQGWKVSPCVRIAPHTTFTVAEIEGPGAIKHMWMTLDYRFYRQYVLRIYWDGEKEPSVCVPIGDFFCHGWLERTNVNSVPIVVNPSGGFNSYWEMPFRKKCLVTLENLSEEAPEFFYQINYILTDIPEDRAYFHAQWRRMNPTNEKEEYVILDDVKGRGQYVGTYVAWQANSNGWWGEGEVKFFLDGDREFPTICTTGTEDYFGGAWGFTDNTFKNYQEFSSPYCGLPQIIRPDGFTKAKLRFGMYRWHICDPIRFTEELKVTMQALGWRNKGRFLPLRDDIASVAYWYQTEPHSPFKQNLDPNHLEVI